MKRLLGPLVLSAALLAAAPAASGITLEPLGRTAAQGEGGAEIAAFHAGTERAFVTNAAGGTLDIYDFSDPSAPVLLESVALPGGPNSVDVSERGLVAVAVEADPVTGPGTVEFFNTDGDALGSLPAGALPDMLTFVYGDRYLLVANEGEADGEPIVDPNGRRDRNRAGKNFVEIQGPHRVARRRAALRRSAHRLRGVDSPTPSRLTRTAVSLTTSRPTRATPAIATAAKRRRGRVNSRWIQLRSPTMRATTRSSAA